MTKKLGLLLVSFSLVVAISAPAISYAGGLTSAQVSAIMSLLQSFGADQSVINNVQTSLTGGTPSATTPTANQFCYTFARNLKIGSSGDDVSALQYALQQEGLLSTSGADKGTLGESTASAIVGFQEKYASEILAPGGLSHGTGFIGASTRAKLNSLYGCGNNQTPTLPTPTPYPQSITITSPNGGQQYQQGSSIIVDYWVTYGMKLTIHISSVNGVDYYSGNDGATVGENKTVLPPEASNVPAGQYRITLCDRSKGDVATCAVGYFTIVSPVQSSAQNYSQVPGCASTSGYSTITGALCSSVTSSTPPTIGVCSQDVLQCSDGSYVSRVAPSCNFKACPTSSGQPTIAGVTGAQSNYAPGGTIDVSVKGLESGGTPASSDKGYNVQAYIFQASDTNFRNALSADPAYSYNGVFDSNSGYWKVRMNVPASGNYNLRLVLYCSQQGSACYNAIGHGEEAVKVLPFAVSTSGKTITLSPVPFSTSSVIAGKAGFELLKINLTLDNGTENVTDIYATDAQSGGQTNLANLGLYQGSTLIGSPTYITNLNNQYYSNATQYQFHFASPISLVAGQNVVLTVRGDILAGASGSIQMQASGIGTNAAANGVGFYGPTLPIVASNTGTVSAQSSITIISPNGNENFPTGSIKTISWNSQGVSKVSIWLCKSGVCNRLPGIPTVGIQNTNSYSWTVPISDTVTNVYKIRVASEDQYPTSTVYDDSDIPFSIAPTSTPSATLISPNGGETFSKNDAIIVRWSTSAPSGVRGITLTNVDTNTSSMVYRVQNGMADQGLTLGTFPIILSGISWVTPGRYTISVYTTFGGSGNDTYDTSNNYFTITAPTSAQPSISSITPNSGPTGTQVTIYGNNLCNTSGNSGSNWIWFNGYSFSATTVSADCSNVALTIPNTLTAGNYGVAVKTSTSLPASNSVNFTITSPTSNNLPPTITSFYGSGTVTIGQNAFWTLNAQKADQDLQAYSIDWGDGAVKTIGNASGSSLSVSTNHTYANAGTYTITAYVDDTHADEATKTVTVAVTAPASAQPSISGVSTPQSLTGTAGAIIPVNWTTQNWGQYDYVNIYLVDSNGTATLVRSNQPNTGASSITINAAATSDQTYKIRVSSVNNPSVSADSGYFTVRAPVISTQQPTISQFSATDPTATGRSATLTWNSSNASYCNISGPNYSSSAGLNTSGSSSTGYLSSDSNSYTITCYGSGLSATRTISVNVPAAATVACSYTTSDWTPASCSAGSTQSRTIYSSPAGCVGGTPPVSTQSCPTTQVPLPVINFYTDSTTISSGTTPTLRWSATNAVSCAPASGNFYTTNYTSGASTASYPQTASATYTISCANSAGQTSTASVTINVTQPTTPPVCSYTASDWTPPVCPSSGQQTRTVSSSPSGCAGGTPPASTQSCVYVPPASSGGGGGGGGGGGAPVLTAPANGTIVSDTSLGGGLLKWQAMSGVSLYNLQMANDAGFSIPILNTITGLTDSSYNYTTLTASRTFYWRVRTLINGVYGDWSAVNSFTTSGPASFDFKANNTASVNDAVNQILQQYGLGQYAR